VARVPRDEAMTFTSEVRLSRSRRSLVVVAVAILVVSASAFWLAESGTLSLPQAPTPNGAGGSGVLSTFTALTPTTVTVPLGQGAQVATGELLGKVTVAAGYAPRIQIDISWLNPQDAGAVLNNPNGWMTFGLYYPIHTGTCTGGDASGSQSITVGVAALCVAPNTQASGPVTWFHTGDVCRPRLALNLRTDRVNLVCPCWYSLGPEHLLHFGLCQYSWWHPSCSAVTTHNLKFLYRRALVLGLNDRNELTI
jgi:hypothetical protein